MKIFIEGIEYDLVPKSSPDKEPERDWEVLSYLNLKHNSVMEAQVQPSDLGDPTRWAIYAVKRFSDNSVFRVGDKFSNNNEVIKSFEIVDNNIKVWVESLGFYFLNQIAKLPEKRLPLFTTHDGTDVFNDDSEIYYISGSYTIITKKAKNAVYLDNKKFYLRENAEEYVLMNKPTLSVNDILALWCIENPARKQLIELSKSKL